MLKSQMNLRARWYEVQQVGRRTAPPPKGAFAGMKHRAMCRGMEMQESGAEEKSTHTKVCTREAWSNKE